MRTRLAIIIAVLIALIAVTFGTLGAAARSSSEAATPKRGGTLTIARQEDSQSFDKTNVFQNESIWIAEKINEPLTARASSRGSPRATRSRRTARRTRSSCARAYASRTGSR